MKAFVVTLALMAACASAMPRYLVVPLDQVEIEEVPSPQLRYRRQAPVEGVPGVALAAARRQHKLPFGQPVLIQEEPEPVEAEQGYFPGSFIGAIKEEGVPLAEDQLVAGSAPYPHQGNDYVDYGAYTGKHGAFGWYSDHPVLIFEHAHGYH